MSFTPAIISWYRKNKRDLPWRDTCDPYLIWLSEIILQQTRVEQGLPYYYKFIEAFPDVKALAAADEEKVLRLWQGLGYYSRARNLHAAAKDIVHRFNGKFPSVYEDIRSLKGVGDYTAAAIASFAFRLPYPVVDGNVFRLITRYYGIDLPIDKASTKKYITSVCESLIDRKAPDVFNQAIMEFGAIQCKPSSPDCASCPLSQSCKARLDDMVDQLPYKEKKTAVRPRYFHYFIIENNDQFYIRKRTAKDIWQGLHDFPLIETANEKLTPAEAKRSFAKPAKVSSAYKHVLSHQHIHAVFYHVHEKELADKKVLQSLIRVDHKSVKKYAVPRLIEKYVGSWGVG